MGAAKTVTVTTKWNPQEAGVKLYWGLTDLIEKVAAELGSEHELVGQLCGWRTAFDELIDDLPDQEIEDTMEIHPGLKIEISQEDLRIAQANADEFYSQTREPF
jgi:hypothetical protein